MILDEKPPLDEALLVHFGVPGMKWGRRKVQTTKDRAKSFAQNHRFTVKVASALVSAGGALAATGILLRTGNYPHKPGPLTNRATAKGRVAASKVRSRPEWKSNVGSVSNNKT